MYNNENLTSKIKSNRVRWLGNLVRVDAIRSSRRSIKGAFRKRRLEYKAETDLQVENSGGGQKSIERRPKIYKTRRKDFVLVILS